AEQRPKRHESLAVHDVMISRWRDRVTSRPSSPSGSSSHDTLAPSFEFPITPVVAPPEIRRRLAILIRPVIMEYLVKISKKARILELKQRYLKITILTPNTSYPSRKIWHICARTLQKDHEGNKINTSYPGKTNTPYSSYGNKIFRNISNVVPTPRNPQYAVSKTFDASY
ncbi:hypothetical protein Tco_1332334, partial [Tanacetum coccineum]